METIRISTDKKALDVPLIHRFLSEQSGWARGISLALVEKSIQHSLCFGGYLPARDTENSDQDRQVAFARVITDYATFANLVDVFVLPAYRGHGFSKTLMREVLSHPQLQGLRRFTLATADAHSLYAQFGFTSPLKPDTLMERYFPEVYATQRQITST